MSYENETKEKMKAYYKRRIAILEFQILKKEGSLKNLKYALKTLESEKYEKQ